MGQVFSERIRESIIIIIICEKLLIFLYHAKTVISLDFQQL
jgi:hypothetical protein